MWLLKLIGWLVLGAIGLVLVSAFLNEDVRQFEVRRTDAWFNGDGLALEITNIGMGPATIKSILVNDRTECSAKPTFALGSKGGNFPMKLDVGEKVTAAGPCRAIRTTIVSEKQSTTYSFK